MVLPINNNQDVEQEAILENLKHSIGANHVEISQLQSLVTKLEATSHNSLEAMLRSIRSSINLTAISTAPQPHRSGKRILIAGFFGAFNLGDELMLETLLNYIKEFYPSSFVTIMLSDNYACDITRYGGYHFIHYPDTILEINAIAEQYDVLIFSGGAIIDDVNFGLANHPLTLGTVLLTLSLRFAVMKKACIIYGLSSNEILTNSAFATQLSLVAQTVHHLSLRDDNSLTSLIKAGVSTDRIKLVNDIVFANSDILLRPRVNPLEIGLIYIYNEKNFSKLVTFTRRLLGATEDKVKFKLILFYDYQDNDLMFSQRLVKRINNPRLTIENESLGNFKQTIETLGSKNTVVSMRYHGTLLANALNRRVICINYDTHPHYPNKNDFIYKQYGFSKNMINFSQINSLSPDALHAMLQSSVERQNLRNIHTEARKELKSALKGIKV